MRIAYFGAFFMSEAAAVLEREAAPPETGTDDAPTGALSENETGTEREAQTGTEPDDTEDVTEPDPEEAAIEARVEARVAERFAQQETEAKAKAEAEATERETADREKRHAALYPNTVQATEAAVKALPLYDQFGQPIEWTPAMLDTLTAPFKAAHLTMWDDTKAAMYGPIQSAVRALIPESAYEDFKKEASGKLPEDYFRIATKYFPPHPEWVKGIELDDMLKLSPKLKAAHTSAIDKAVKADRVKPRKAGEPSSNGSPASAAGPTPRDMDEARSWHVSGKLSNSQFRAFQASQGK